jgi:hypothetical protein
MSTHLYVEKGQPLTRFKWYGVKRYSGFAPNDTTHRCHTCGRRRAAKNLRIQTYYDKDHVFCREGHYMDRYGRWITKS